MARKNLLRFLLFLGDLFLMYGALLLTLAVRYGDFSFWPGPQTRTFLFHFSFVSLLWSLILFALDFYELPPLRKVYDFFKNLIIFIFLAGAVGVIYFYLKPVIAPKTILFLDVLIFSVFLTGWRYLFSQILKLQNFREKIVIIASPIEVKEFPQPLLSQNGYRLVASFNPDSNLDFAKIKEIIQKEKVDLIVLGSDFYKRKEKIFQHLPLQVKYISFVNFYESLNKKVSLEMLEEVWFLENIAGLAKRNEDILKRGFDILFSIVGLLVLIVLFPFIALAIKIDSSGSVVYSQKRVGKDGKTFTFYKFRTMKADAEKEGSQWAKPNDPRITSVGRALRAVHLDELPQFWNILKGDLSFVGPRAEWEKLAKMYEKEIPFYSYRYLIRPGFTGWAQLNYPASQSVEEAKEKFKYDLYYIKNRSFFLDLGIILKTIQLFFR